MDVLTLKREALDQRQLLQRYSAIYEAFQKYVECLTPVVCGAQPDPALLVSTAEKFRLLYLEYETQFCEWENGNEIINKGVAAFLNPDFLRKEEFRMMLLLATAKFEDLLGKAGRNLKELHEEIALVEGQDRAEEVTRVPSSALRKLKNVDAVAEILSKWLGRAVRFTPWAIDLLSRMHGLEEGRPSVVAKVTCWLVSCARSAP
jgi:hypothetical protein